MYLYFNSKGVLEEVVNDIPTRKDSSNVNHIYVYIDGVAYNTDDKYYPLPDSIESLSTRYQLPDGTITPVALVQGKVQQSIPYDKHRDMKCFKDFYNYEFFDIELPSGVNEDGSQSEIPNVLGQSGLVALTIIEQPVGLALGLVVFNVEQEVGITTDTLITEAQFNYLMGYVAKYDKQVLDIKTLIPDGTTENNKLTNTTIVQDMIDANMPTFTNSTIWTKEFIDKVRKVGYAVYHSTANISQLYSVCAKNLPGKDITLMTINYASNSILIYGISLNGTIELSVTQNLVIYSDDGRIERVATPINNSDAANKTYVDTTIKQKLASTYVYKGSVQTYADLPTNANNGDVYNVIEAYQDYPAGTNFAWTGTQWDALGGSIDLSDYATIEYVNNESDRLQNLSQDNHDDITKLNNRVSAQETEIEGVKLYAQSTQEDVNELKASLYGYVFGEDTANFSKLDISALPRIINNFNVADNTRLALNNITGRAIKWTQLIDASIFISSRTVSGVTFTINQTNGTITVNGTATEDINESIMIPGEKLNSNWIPTAYFYLKGCPSGGSESTYWLEWANMVAKDIGNGVYRKVNANGGIPDTISLYCNPTIHIKSGVTMTNKVFRPQVFNVSDIYGLGKEPATKEDFDKDYPLQVYPYGKQEILTTKVSGIKIRAGYKNLLNVFVNTNTISGVTITKNNDGTFTANGTASEDIAFLVASAQNINVSLKMNSMQILLQGCPANGSTNTYYLRNNWSYSNDTGNGVINYLSYQEARISITVSIIIKQGTVCNNLVFKPQLINLTNTYGAGNEPTTPAQFNQDFPDIDNIPYPEQTISFPEQTLYDVYNISKTKDELNIVKNGNVYELQFTKRMSVISDISLQNWGYDNDSEYGLSFYLRIDNSTGSQGAGDYPTVLCPKYTSLIIKNMISTKYNKTLTNTTYYFFLIDTKYTDVASFKAANKGVPLYYASANPKTTTIATLTKNQVTALFAKGYCVEILGNDDNKIIVRPNLKLDMVTKLIGGNTNE